MNNPERYTGYARERGASFVWRQIHEYNAFYRPSDDAKEEAAADAALESMDVEERCFGNALSGLHASISSHIATGYLLDKTEKVYVSGCNSVKARGVVYAPILLVEHYIAGQVGVGACKTL